MDAFKFKVLRISQYDANNAIANATDVADANSIISIWI